MKWILKTEKKNIFKLYWISRINELMSNNNLCIEIKIETVRMWECNRSILLLSWLVIYQLHLFISRVFSQNVSIVFFIEKGKRNERHSNRRLFDRENASISFSIVQSSGKCQFEWITQKNMSVNSAKYCSIVVPISVCCRINSIDSCTSILHTSQINYFVRNAVDASTNW